jgi:sugar lactone lactonase YvrE
VKVRRLFTALALVSLAGCGKLNREGMLLVLDPAYQAETLLTEADGISSPDGLRWEEGALYIADEGGSAVRVLKDGRLVTLAGSRSGLKSPEDLARGADGALYWTDDDAGGLWRLGSNGKAERRLPAKGPLESTEGLVLAPSGAFLVGGGEAGRIVSLRQDGRTGELPLRIEKPESMAFDASGNLYIADNRADILYVVTKDGRLHRAIANREGFSPETLHFAGGALLITDSRNGKLHRYTPEDGLATVAVLAGTLGNVQGVTSDETGSIYLSVQTDLKAKRGTILRLKRRGKA